MRAAGLFAGSILVAFAVWQFLSTVVFNPFLIPPPLVGDYSSGNYSYRFNPSSAYRYRAVISGTYARSGPISVASRTDDRTLEQRAASLASIMALRADPSSL